MAGHKLPPAKVLEQLRALDMTLQEIGNVYGATPQAVSYALKRSGREVVAKSPAMAYPPQHVLDRWRQNGMEPAEMNRLSYMLRYGVVLE